MPHSISSRDGSSSPPTQSAPLRSPRRGRGPARGRRPSCIPSQVSGVEPKAFDSRIAISTEILILVRSFTGSENACRVPPSPWAARDGPQQRGGQDDRASGHRGAAARVAHVIDSSSTPATNRHCCVALAVERRERIRTRKSPAPSLAPRQSCSRTARSRELRRTHSPGRIRRAIRCLTGPSKMRWVRWVCARSKGSRTARRGNTVRHLH